MDDLFSIELCCFKDTLYTQTISFVQFIRDLTGAPNDPKWNSVLFGGRDQAKEISFERISFSRHCRFIVFTSAIFLFNFMWHCIRSLRSKAHSSYLNGKSPSRLHTFAIYSFLFLDWHFFFVCHLVCFIQFNDFYVRTNC